MSQQLEREMTILESDNFDLVVGRTCKVCGERGVWFDDDYNFEIILEPDLRNWLVGFVNEEINRLQHEVETGHTLMAYTDNNFDPRNGLWMYWQHLEIGWKEESIGVLLEIRKQFHSQNQNKLLLNSKDWDKMSMLHYMLEHSVDHYLKSSDEYSIEQVKMATRMIDIMKRQSLLDGICHHCILQMKYILMITVFYVSNVFVREKQSLGLSYA